MTKEICKYTGKSGYVESEDCHCFCCGTHEGKKPKNHSPHVNKNTPKTFASEGTFNLSEKLVDIPSQNLAEHIWIHKDDIKEFIKRILEYYDEDRDVILINKEDLLKLAGDDLK